MKIEKIVKKFIQNTKILRDRKFYKTNKVSLAAYDSRAAIGLAGGCNICKAKHYNATFHNKTFTTMKGDKRSREWYWQEFGKVCEECLEEIEKQCDYKFIKY